MVVNSLSFLWFFLIILVIYYICQTKRSLQNLFLLGCSYWFYSQVGIKMAGGLAALTLAFWFLGKGVSHYLDKEDERKAAILTNAGVVIGIGALFYFKYLNFFAESIVSLSSAVGLHLSWTTLHMVVPIGLSFFTFKLMSYVLDIYNGKIHQEKDLICFANFIAFFPTILSGPIDRPKPFLKQLNQVRVFNPDNFTLGFRRVLWGMFLKMCIADRLDIYVSAIWNNYEHHSTISIIFASLLYPLQMYADFGGYSEMAIGVALILGFKVTENFKRPFFVTDIAGFWSRWHMSLTSWLTDYVFLPLNIRYRKLGVNGTIIAIMLNMAFIGMWHGADWTFLIFGIYQGLWYIPLMRNGAFFKKRKIEVNSHSWPTQPYVLKMAGLYLIVAFGLMFFHSSTLSEFFNIWSCIFSHWSGGLFIDMATMCNAAFCTIALIYTDIQEEWFPKTTIPLPRVMDQWRYELTMAFEIVCILLFGVFDNNQFIYFQF